MAERDSGRPPAEAFYTVSDSEQARLLSNQESFRFFEPFVARELTATAAAAEVGCKLDTMLYRIRTFLKARLLQVSRLEKRAGRPVKHYHSVYDAYFIPFEVTPYAEVEERLVANVRKGQAVVVPAMARVLREMGREGRRVYRRRDNNEVWQESAGDTYMPFDLYSEESYNKYMETYRGPIAEMIDDILRLNDQEAKELLTSLYEVWRRFQGRQDDTTTTRKPYFLQFTVVPLEL